MGKSLDRSARMAVIEPAPARADKDSHHHSDSSLTAKRTGTLASGEGCIHGDIHI